MAPVVSFRPKQRPSGALSDSRVSIQKTYSDSDYNTKLTSATDVQQREQEIRSIVTMSSMIEDSLSDSDSATSGSVVDFQSSYIELDNTNFDFLSTFTKIPSLDEISEESQQLNSVFSVKEEKEIEEDDEGVFVDPLTGEVFGKVEEDWKPVDEIDTKADVTEAEEEESKESEMQFSFSEDSELLQLAGPAKLEIVVPALDDEAALENFLTQEVKVEPIPTLISAVEAYERERLHKMLASETDKFMNELIDEVVHKVEYADPTEMLRTSFDKLALMDEIEDKLEDLELKRKIRFYLNRKVIEYHKRKNLYRAITDESPNDVTKEMKKFKDLTRRLDHVLSLEKEMIEKSEQMKTKLYAKLDELQHDNDEKEKELESLVYKTLVQKSSEKLPMIISILLANISTFRNEISKVLFELIKKQHTNALLEEKINQYERDLRIREYEVLQTETIDLTKKIQECNAELIHFRARCTSEIHTISHLKEKSNILRVLTSIKTKALATLIQNKKDTRENLVGLKVERARLQNEIRELTYQSGLLGNPLLLRDYDATVAEAEKLRKRIKLLGAQRSDLINKIAKIEEKCRGKQSEEEFVN